LPAALLFLIPIVLILSQAGTLAHRNFCAEERHSGKFKIRMSKASENTRPIQAADWERIASTQKFRSLLREKRRFVVPATCFFVIYYFALPVLVGYFPELMSRPVLGPVNLAYLFALSQFLMAWILAWLYVRAAERFDKHANELKIDGERG
jgi:uncharacterized membrane protein (DUF485 family)